MESSFSEELVIASANKDKVSELRDLLSDTFTVLDRPEGLPETIEDGDTLLSNALKKATEISEVTDKAALADDTGLFVDVLDGAPGVFSARYSGESATYTDNVNKLLKELEKFVSPTERQASFRTVVALVKPDGSSITAEGSIEGYISLSPKGDRGFGYDPVFVPHEADGQTFAEMNFEAKQLLSHRSRALQNFLEKVKDK